MYKVGVTYKDYSSYEEYNKMTKSNIKKHCYICDGVNTEIKSSGLFDLCKECFKKDLLITLTNAKKDYGLTDDEIDVLPCKRYTTQYGVVCSLYLLDDIKRIAENKHGDIGLYERKKHHEALQRTSNRIKLQDKRRKAIKKKIETAGFVFDEGSDLVQKYITGGKPSMKVIVEDMHNKKRIREEKIRRDKLLRETLERENLSEQIYSNRKNIYLNEVDRDMKLEDVISDIRNIDRIEKTKKKREQILQKRLCKLNQFDYEDSHVRHQYLVDVSDAVTINDVIKDIIACHELQRKNDIIREQRRKANKKSKLLNVVHKCVECHQVRAEKCVEKKCGSCCDNYKCPVAKHWKKHRGNRRQKYCDECGKSDNEAELFKHWAGMGPRCEDCIESNDYIAGFRWESI